MRGTFGHRMEGVDALRRFSCTSGDSDCILNKCPRKDRAIYSGEIPSSSFDISLL